MKQTLAFRERPRLSKMKFSLFFAPLSCQWASRINQRPIPTYEEVQAAQEKLQSGCFTRNRDSKVTRLTQHTKVPFVAIESSSTWMKNHDSR